AGDVPAFPTRRSSDLGRAEEVLDEVFDLFVNLDANDEQLDFPVLFASGRNGYAGTTPDVREGDMSPLFEKIVEHVPEPDVDPDRSEEHTSELQSRENL